MQHLEVSGAVGPLEGSLGVKRLMLNVFRMLIHSFSGACNLFVELFCGLYCSNLMCVGVTLWYGCGGVVSVCRLKH